MKEAKMRKAQDKSEITKIKKDLLLATQQCIACEFCVPSCPLYSGWLSDSATGRMQSLHYAVKKGWKLDDRLRNILYSCTLCGACELKCKNLSQSVKVVDIIKKARQLFTKAGKGPMPVHQQMIESLETSNIPRPSKEKNAQRRWFTSDVSLPIRILKLFRTLFRFWKKEELTLRLWARKSIVVVILLISLG
jgi:Fe-S oxidoreductase